MNCTNEERKRITLKVLTAMQASSSPGPDVFLANLGLVDGHVALSVMFPEPSWRDVARLEARLDGLVVNGARTGGGN
jgi:hypothetical protein